MVVGGLTPPYALERAMTCVCVPVEEKGTRNGIYYMGADGVVRGNGGSVPAKGEKVVSRAENKLTKKI